MNPNQTPGRCSRCGAELPAQLPGGLCPKCLLEAGLGTQPERGPEDTVITPQPPALRGIPRPGEQFGHYRLVRLLGQGGMGVVFEAEDLETGRRVALKILSQALDSPEARKRFLREGQIAGAINHPNSVYVFGTEEIAGTPVIAMELVGGGTLRDRVVASGPYPAAEAVDTLLQIIAGLEAAQQAGVLHRDVKPSNCFIDPDGTVKIGDFGLSISTSVRTESNLTGPGSLFGTPAFSSPEQLRGEELTVRSDIYSVGVTLYYLLTGRMPFEAPNMVQLLVTVLERRPQSPARLRAGIPEALGRAVLRCLNKDPGARFDGYAALRKALLPYASSSPTPATLALRLGAWLVDHLLLNASVSVMFFTVIGGYDTLLSPGHRRETMLLSLFSLLLAVGYYGLFDGLRGGSPGKMIFRLRVVVPDGNLPGWRRGLLRAVIFCAASALPALAIILIGQEWLMGHPLITMLASFIQLLLFCTCRRQNGFAGLHDLGSRTRVLAYPLQAARPGQPSAPETPAAAGGRAQMGPYHILAELGRSGEAEMLLGYDSRLLRKVWLRRVPSATPPVGLELRHLARPGRFRWLNGKRSGEEAWDVYEAAAGRPLLELLATQQDWDKVRFWLLDLAEELKAAEKDGSLPAALGPDRVWITTDGHAKLLDFPAPGAVLTGELETARPAGPAEFLRQTAYAALEGRPLSVAQSRASTLVLPLPLYARGFLKRLGDAAGIGEIGAQLKLLVGKRAAITRGRRSAMLALVLAFPLLTALMGLLMFRGGLMKNSMEMAALQVSLLQVQALEPAGTNAPAQSTADAEKSRQLEVYIAGRFGRVITNSDVWDGLQARAAIQPAQRALAGRVVAGHPQVTPEEFAGAKTAVESQYHIPPAWGENTEAHPGIMELVAIMLYVFPLFYVVFPCFLAALLFRGGLIQRGLGIAVVGRNGRPSRWRTLRRNVIAWLPFVLSPLLFHRLEQFMDPQWALPATAAILGLLTLVSLTLGRSLQDRLARTWLVPDGKMPADEVADAQRRGRWPVVPIAVGAGALVVFLLLVQLARFVSDAQKKMADQQAGRSPAVYVVPAKDCVALLPDGTPAANAQVWVATNNNASVNAFRPGEYTSFGMQKIQADAQGRFTLPGVADERRVILTDPSGSLVTMAAVARKGTPVRLQPFGRVEGQLLSEGKPKSGAQISIGDAHGPYGLVISYSAVSGVDGRFTFTNLAAGEYRLYRVFFPHADREGGFEVQPSHQKFISVPAGETVRVQWGGDGRAVTGQAVAKNPAIEVDWLNDNHSLELVSSAAGLTKFVRESWGMGNSSAQEVSDVHNSRSYHLEFAEDGSFQAEDVPPGKYELRIRVTKPKPGPNPFMAEGEELGLLKRIVTIPAGTEPYDLGRQIVAVKGKPAGAPGRPMDATLTTVDGQSLTLASLRGKQVVIVFWASWSEPSRKALAGLKAVRDEFAPGGRVEFIAASVDDEADSLREAVASVPAGFTPVRLAMGERVAVIEAFEVGTLPAVLVLGPDGRVVARNLEAGRLRDLLRQELAGH